MCIYNMYIYIISTVIILFNPYAPITTVADNIYKYFFIVFQRKKNSIPLHFFKSGDIIRLDISCESSARQRIHMKHQALFPLKDKSKTIKCRLLQFLLGALRVNLSCYPSRMTSKYQSLY